MTCPVKTDGLYVGEDASARIEPSLRVDRDDRAAARRPLAVRLRELDAVLQRLLRRLLELQVERQPHRVAGRGGNRRHERAARPAERVDVAARRRRRRRGDTLSYEASTPACPISSPAW